MRRPLFTIGHSLHPIERFVELLELHDVEAVCDVRSTPYSRRNPQFNREALPQPLRARGIQYVFLGAELGARSGDPTCYVNGRARYALIASTHAFRAGLTRVVRGAQRLRIALMCAEADPLGCHRTILVCRQLEAEDLEICHILRDGSLESHARFESRLLQATGLAQTRFFDQGGRSAAQPLERAYAAQAARIEFVKRPGQRSAGVEGP